MFKRLFFSVVLNALVFKHHMNLLEPCILVIPLAMMCGLLAGQKQRLWRVSRAWRRWGARSASSSRTPLTLRIHCWMSSANERLSSSFNHRVSRFPAPAAAVALTPPALGSGTEVRACRKLFWGWSISVSQVKTETEITVKSLVFFLFF